MKLILKIAPICLAFLSSGVLAQAQEEAVSQQGQETVSQEALDAASPPTPTDANSDLALDPELRTVDPSEVGLIFTAPNGVSWADVGASEGSITRLSQSAVKIRYARATVFRATDQSEFGFPWSALKSYEAAQVRAGHAPIFVTATYAGRKRPVVWAWSLGLSNGRATSAPSRWQYAVNVGDPRFVNFWVNNWVRPVLYNPARYLGNIWFMLDECAFNWGLYGVLDDSGRFIPGVRWDEPFPQNASEYLSSVGQFFTILKNTAPDIKTMANLGTMSNPSQYQTVVANMPGALSEDLYSWHAHPSASAFATWFQQNFTIYSWLGSHNRVAIVGAHLSASDTQGLRTSFAIYELLKGPNFFFAPRINTSPARSIPPDEWTPASARLGNPVATFQSRQQAGRGIGNRLFWRQYSGGYVYLNWTGVTQTVTLPSGHTWLDPNNRVVTRITIPYLTGTYVRSSN